MGKAGYCKESIVTMTFLVALKEFDGAENPSFMKCHGISKNEMGRKTPSAEKHCEIFKNWQDSKQTLTEINKSKAILPRNLM
ncbi:43629_t:CDS:2 [Gigaspora margarita]|uniref:43629_t:CDS:1 n=1 Tax=Gigaspora margarita TaxID=4874 RepID=A0ABM8VXG0_GIGMA|nr:43629_t:CDS:2 [Gigaspora margarita]